MFFLTVFLQSGLPRATRLVGWGKRKDKQRDKTWLANVLVSHTGPTGGLCVSHLGVFLSLEACTMLLIKEIKKIHYCNARSKPL